MNNLIHTIAVVVQVLSALGVIALVLIQHGKGADMGAAFGSGSSGSLFGATGSANFLSRLTAVLAATFFISTLGLAFLANDAPRRAPGSLREGAVPSAPGSPASMIPGSVAPAAGPKDVPTVGGQGSATGAGQPAGQGSVPPVPSSPAVPSSPSSSPSSSSNAPSGSSSGASSSASPAPSSPAAAGSGSALSDPAPKQ